LLAGVEQGLACTAGHHFDQAQEGYVHLLPGGARGKFPGDSPPMLRARRRFLARGFYAPLAAALNGRVQTHLKYMGHEAGVMAEAGCGEGFYIGAVQQHLARCGLADNWRCWGFDLAKEAVRMAARRHEQVGFFVADTYRPWLFSDAALSVLLTIFAPRNADESARVVRPGGVVLVVLPGTDHLKDMPPPLRPVGIAPGKLEGVVEQFSGMFKLTGQERLVLSLTLDSEALTDLVLMTPSQRHITPAVLADLQGMKIRADFILLAFQRC